MSESPVSSIPVEVIRKLMVFPFREDREFVHIYAPESLNGEARKELEFLSGKSLKIVPKSEKEIGHFIEEKYRLKGTIKEISKSQNTSKGKAQASKEVAAPEPPPASSTPVQILEFIFDDAITKRSTDIHIERTETEAKVRFRIDGILIPQEVFPLEYFESIVSRIKILSKLDIGEKRLPQDGKFEYKKYDIRVSILPGYSGEAVVLRILNKEIQKFDLAGLGFYPEDIAAIKTAISKPSGLLLVAGPTGSGKNTTLYAILQMLDSVGKKVITIEDPVEYISGNFLQIQVKPQIGLDFATGLRSVLRSDPDVLLVGEMRDKETGEIAVEFSNTGHLVFSTVHSNDNPGAIRRLTNDMGVSPDSVAESLRLIISQRLVRKVCSHCAEKENGETIGTGCRECHGTGYLGRTAVYEILSIDEDLREKIRTGVMRPDDVAAALKRRKGLSLGELAKKKISEGVTNSIEISRAI